jgi:alkylation response protein AidB-like acyl-CoA dehydrogenase
MSVDLGLSPDQESIQELFATFFTKEAPLTVAREAEPLGFDRTLWDKVRGLEAPGMSSPGAAGGSDASWSDLVVVAEALGRNIAPIPLVEHLVAAPLHPEADVVSGEAIATLALHPARPDGTWRLVPAGAVADVVIGLDDGELVAVRSAPPGAGPRNHAAAPLAHRSARVGERVVLGNDLDHAAAVDRWRTLTAAALVGISGAALDMGVDYAKARHQFGVPIGSFQAIQHLLADLPTLVDGGRLLAHKAAWAADGHGTGAIDPGDSDIQDVATLAAMAFVFAADGARIATDRALHVHGGYGFAEEYDAQLLYRRARGWALVLDDPTRERLRLADRLFGPTGSR